MKRVCNGKILSLSFQGFRIDQDFFPLHQISKDKLLQAESILN